MSMAMGALQSDSDYVLYIYTKGANTKLRDKFVYRDITGRSI